jgi:hypothetical protein
MIVCVCKPLNLPEKKGEVVFDASLITYVARLVKVISSSGIFNQSTVNVIFPLFRRAQIPKDDGQLIVEASNDAMILDLLK